MGRGPDRSVTRSDVLAEMESEVRPWTANALAEELPCSSDTVYNRLRELETLGEIATMKVGSRARVWWIPDTSRGIEVSPYKSGTKKARIVETMASDRDAARPWTTSELEEATGIDQNIVYNQLRDIEDDDAIRSMKAGARAKVWWLQAGVEA